MLSPKKQAYISYRKLVCFYSLSKRVPNRAMLISRFTWVAKGHSLHLGAFQM